jgi:hypothetical protein
VKRIARFTFILAVMALTALTASSSFAQEAAAPSTTAFCWLDTKVRDVGEAGGLRREPANDRSLVL